MDVQSLKLNDYLVKLKLFVSFISETIERCWTKSMSYIIDIREKYDFGLTAIAKCRRKKCRLNFLGESSRAQLLQN